jgi:lipopolysaccharide assembly outer membrane protein LptD (OstA)
VLRKSCIIGTFVLAAVLFCIASVYAGEMHLTSDRMQYDPDKGTIYAEGNVKFIRDGMTITSKRGEGSVDGSSALFWENVKGEGVWSEEEILFTCDMAEAIFSPHTFYSLKGKVDSKFGDRIIIADMVEMQDEEFSAVKVEKFVDKAQGLEMSCDKVEGVLKDKEISEAIAQGKVRILIRDDQDKQTRVFGNKAVYSKKRGSIVVTGNARAIQGDRSIKANSLVLFPETNRIEAAGGSTLVITPDEKKEN